MSCPACMGNVAAGKSCYACGRPGPAGEGKAAPPVERVGKAAADEPLRRAYREVAALADERRRALGPNDYADGLDRACEVMDTVFRSRAVPQASAEPNPDGGERLREAEELLLSISTNSFDEDELVERLHEWKKKYDARGDAT